MTSIPFGSKRSAALLIGALRSDPHAPLTAMIEIADRCNETCVHCYQIQGRKGELPTEDWRRVIDELAEMGVLFLTISGGEATLRTDFLELVRHARERRFAVKLYTNGLTMTRELAHSLAELAVQEVQISLYSPRAEVHDWVTGVPGSWERTVQAARWLVEERVAVLLKTPVMTINAADLDEYIELAGRLGAHYAFDPQIDPREDGDRETERLRVDDEVAAKLYADPRLSTMGGAGPAGAASLEASVCGACSGNVHIEANGEMRPCTQLGVAVGHALRDGVRAAWSHNETGATMRQLVWRDLHGCRDCDLQPYCGRCFANARIEGGDALGPYASACQRARLVHRVRTGVALELGALEGREASVGPYRIESGTLQPIPDRITDGDRALAARLAWTRADTSSAPGERAIEPGQLVQIRRPGRKRAKLETVPSVQPPQASRD